MVEKGRTTKGEFLGLHKSSIKKAAKKTSDRYQQLRAEHESRTIKRNEQKTKIESSRAGLAEQKARTERAKASQRRSGKSGRSPGLLSGMSLPRSKTTRWF